MYKERKNLSKQDNLVLANFFRLADSIADLFGEHCEIVIHSLDELENSVIKIVNGHHTERVVGSPITDFGLRVVSQIEKTGDPNLKSYFARNKKNGLLKSTTFAILGEKNQPIGLFCININLSEPFSEIIKSFMPDNQLAMKTTNENFTANSTELIESAVAKAIDDVAANNISKRMRNKAITCQLLESGIFELKEAIPLVATNLGITKHAVYKYIREYKSEQS